MGILFKLYYGCVITPHMKQWVQYRDPYPGLSQYPLTKVASNEQVEEALPEHAIPL